MKQIFMPAKSPPQCTYVKHILYALISFFRKIAKQLCQVTGDPKNEPK